MSTIAQNTELLKNLVALLEAHRPLRRQQRVYERAVVLALSAIFTFSLAAILLSPASAVPPVAGGGAMH